MTQITTTTITLTATDILALPLGGKHAGLTVTQRSWSDKVSKSAVVLDAIEAGDIDGMYRELGTPESVTLAADGRHVYPRNWCTGHDWDVTDEEVRYERWTAEGRVAHGYVCAYVACRRLVQSG